ncbi:toxin-antitoxin system YwqK family antitoxin [Luteirhabdus pelagi]|uniref:toxin-antitoxin system YwqK family antitoxin n=1 Tax=Luteirhabdus pelagi TaxID=2792783 RepID=UPI001939A3BD|nr:hypothetical protein [Luteirhabdus pelagi]
MKKAFLIFFSILMVASTAVAQEYNQFDSEGKRHGQWRKYYPNSKQLRYEGQFSHGKEIGTFKFYCESCGDKPMVTKSFSEENEKALVKYFTIKGKQVSEGYMKGKQRVGEWLYFHKKSEAVMTREFYEEGKLHGVKTTYYPDGTKTEELSFENGEKQGPNKYYSPEGVLLKELQYENDKLNGPAKYFDADGNAVIEGQYKNGMKDGVWKYYKDGKVEREETFPKEYNRN